MIETGLGAGDVGKPGDQIPEAPERGGRARCKRALDHGVNELGPERARRRHFLQARGEQRQRFGAHGVRIDLLQRLHDPLADAASRHVDDAAQADVVVRIHDQLEVGERVLDLLALVEADAADDLVGSPSRISASSIARDCALVR